MYFGFSAKLWLKNTLAKSAFKRFGRGDLFIRIVKLVVYVHLNWYKSCRGALKGDVNFNFTKITIQFKPSGQELCIFLPDASGFCVLDSHQLRIWALFQSTLEERKRFKNPHEKPPILTHTWICYLESFWSQCRLRIYLTQSY